MYPAPPRGGWEVPARTALCSEWLCRGATISDPLKACLSVAYLQKKNKNKLTKRTKPPKQHSHHHKSTHDDTPRITGFEILKLPRLSARDERHLHRQLPSPGTAWSPRGSNIRWRGSSDVRSGTLKVNVLNSRCPRNNKTAYLCSPPSSAQRCPRESHWANWWSWEGKRVHWVQVPRCWQHEVQGSLCEERPGLAPARHGQF